MSSFPRTLVRWVLACALAETVGLTAASGAAKAVQALKERPEGSGGTAVALGLIVAGGLVEGLALGAAQGLTLSRRWPAVNRGRYITVTAVLAGVGWALASAPGVLAPDEGGPDPPLTLLLAGGAGVGLVMGSLLGTAQAWALGSAVRHPWRWVAANTVAWPPVMAVVYFGASRPEASWSVPAVLAVGALTGLAGGALLGVLTGAWLPSLDGPSVPNRVVLAAVKAQRFGVDDALVGLAVWGRRSGRLFRFPVQWADSASGVVVVPGHAERKRWWRQLIEEPTSVQVLIGGRWRTVTAHLLMPGDPRLDPAITAYRRRWPRAALPPGQPAVLLDVTRSRSAARAGPGRKSDDPS